MTKLQSKLKLFGTVCCANLWHTLENIFTTLRWEWCWKRNVIYTVWHLIYFNLSNCPCHWQLSLYHVDVSYFLSCRSVMVENHLQFGPHKVGASVQGHFTLVNCSKNPVRFEWQELDLSPLSLSPSVGHVHPSSRLEVLAVLNCTKPKSVKKQKLTCKYWLISYPTPISEVGSKSTHQCFFSITMLLLYRVWPLGTPMGQQQESHEMDFSKQG